jgi:hypothetical protein
MQKYRVTLLVENAPGSSEGRFYTRQAKSRGDALLDVLAVEASKGTNLNRVRKSRVTEVLSTPTLAGLNAI